MYRVILIFLLVVVHTSVMAEWIYITETDDEVADEDAYVVYADPDTIQRTLNIVKMWGIFDYRIVAKNGAKSEKRKVEYNCKQRKARMLSVSFHSKQMGRGVILATLNKKELNHHWEEVSPGSIVEASLKFACSFRPEPPNIFSDGVLL